MKKTSILRRGMSLLLSLVMILGYIPTVASPVNAASNLDGGLEGQAADVFTALGFDTSVMPEGYDPNTVDNPYGRKKVTGTQIYEALVSSKNGTVANGVGNGKAKNDLSAFDVVNSSVSGDMPLKMFAVAEADFDNDGLTGEAVYVGYTDSSYASDTFGYLKMYLYDAKTGKFSNVKSLGTVNGIGMSAEDPLMEATESYNYSYANQNMMQVSAGDYDGDGTYEIAVYIGTSKNARVDIYKWMQTADSTADGWTNLDNWSVIWSHILSNDSVPNMVSLHSADINQDGMDDLSISYGEVRDYPDVYQGMTRLSPDDYATKSRAVILWGDRNKLFQNSYALNLDAAGLGLLARVSTTTGDLDGDGYNELVVTGQPLSDVFRNTSRSIIVYQYDGTGGLEKTYSETFKIVDGYRSEGSWVSGNGFDEVYRSSPLMNTNAAVFKPEGFDYSYVYLDSCLYEYVEGILTLKMCLDDVKYDGTNTLSNPWLCGENYVEYGAVTMDMNGSGYQQLFTSYYAEDSLAYMIEYLYEDAPEGHYDLEGGFSGMKGADGKLEAYTKTETHKNEWVYHPDPETGGFPDPETACCNYVTAVNCDKDTVILEYTGRHWLTYTDPEVLAVIAAAPYFKDVDIISDYDYAWQNTTSWSRTEGSGEGSTVQVDLETGAYVSQGSDYNELEVAALFTMEWVKETSKTTEYTLTFETSQDEDAVAFFSIPTEHYEYKIYRPNENGIFVPDDYVVSRPFQAVYQVLNLDYYESIRNDFNNLPAIRGEILTSTPGDPASYPSSASGYDVISQWNQDPAGVSFGNGSITQEITITEEQSESYNLGAAVDTQIGVGYKNDLTGLEFMGGATLSLNPSGGWITYNLSGTTISGTVTNMPLQFQDYGYYYNWSLFSYSARIGEARVPVVSYLVNDVSAPPELPDDFQQDVERTTSDKNVLTWTYDGEYSKFIIYKYFDFPVEGGLEIIGEYAAGEAPYILKYDKNGVPRKEFYFEDTNLTPYAEYQYAIQVERLGKTPPLSAPSALLTARTKAAKGNPVLTVVEPDGTNDGTAMVYPDKNGYLIAQVSGPGGEQGSAYYSTIQYQWQKKNDFGKWVNLDNETNQTLVRKSAGSDTAGEYRCRVNVITSTDNTAISAYTDSVSLVHSKRTSVIETAYAKTLGNKVELYAKVINAHVDSAAVPSGYVIFYFVNISTGANYAVCVRLNSAGVASVVSTNALPVGQYRVFVTYVGSYTFKSSSTEIYHLPGVESGYSLVAPEFVTYGNSAEIFFRKVTKSGGITQTEPADAASIKLLIPYEIETDGTALNVAPGQTPTEEQLNGAILIKSGDRVTQGQKYCIYSRAAGAIVGVYRIFTAAHTGIFEANYLIGWDTRNIFGNVILVERDLIKGGASGTYLVSADIPISDFVSYLSPRGYVIKAVAADGTVVEQEIFVTPRPITLQLPTMVKKLNSEQTMGDITYGELSVLSGSWAACDSDEAGNVIGTVASTSVNPTYTNTAGTAYNQDSAMENCGYYAIDANGTLANYTVTYRTGSLSVIGGTQPITFGVRPFESQTVGTLYMVSPDYAYTREENGVTSSQVVGSRVVFTAAPDEGYQVYDWYVDGEAQGVIDTRFAYEVLNREATVEVQFVFKPDTLLFGIAGATEGGSLTCSDTGLTSGSIVIPNTYLTYTAIAKEGYHFKEWRYTELGKGTSYYTEDNGQMSSSFQLLMPKISCSLYAVFERDGYTLNYTDKNGADGLTAWYWGSVTGDTTAQLEKIFVESGSTVPGDTEIVIHPKDGYALDEDYNFVSTGSQGVADYEKGTYTLILKEDTSVTGYTVQNFFRVTLDFDISKNFTFCQGAQVTLTIDGTEYVYDCPEDNKTYTISGISGGSKVAVSVTYPEYYVFGGWKVNDKLTEDPVYTVAELGEDTTFCLVLKEKPVYQVTLADISGKGTYTVTLPKGAKQEDGVITCHENDALTIMVTPETGYTVTYWNVVADEEDKSWETKASSLKYQFPTLTADYTFTPVFSNTTYHTVTWPLLQYYNTTLTPLKGYLTTVVSGNEFKFTLSGGEGEYNYVVVNGRPFCSTDEQDDRYPYRYEDIDGVRVYTISNITADQVISVSKEKPEYYVTFNTQTNNIPAGKRITLTAEVVGDVNIDVFTWSVDGVEVQRSASNTFVYEAPLTPGATVTIMVAGRNMENGGAYDFTSYKEEFTITDAVDTIGITSKDLTAAEDGSFLIYPNTATGENGKYDFDATVSMYSGATTTDVIWSLWGAQMRGTSIDADGVLTVSPREQGVNGQLKVIATYTYSGGDTHRQEAVINLSARAYVDTKVVGDIHGSVSEVGYVTDGTTVTVTATPDANHQVACWYVDGVAVSGEYFNTLTLSIKDNTRYEVAVEFTHNYPTAEQDEVHHWFTCGCGHVTEPEDHLDFDSDHNCDKCSKVLTACTDEDGDYVCDICGAADSIKYLLSGRGFSLSFEDEVLVNFYYTIADGVEFTEQGMLVYYSEPGKADIATADVVYESKYVAASNSYMAATAGIAAKEMGDLRWYVAYAKLADGTYAYSPMYVYSPATYARNKLADPNSAQKLKALCVAILNYGTAAQKYFGYRTDEWMNASLMGEQKAMVKAYDERLFTGVVPADPSKAAAFAANGGFDAKAVSVSFEGAFQINFYFSPTHKEAPVTLYYWTAADYYASDSLTAQNATGSVAMKTGEPNSVWAPVCGLAAKQLDETVYVAAVYEYNGVLYSSGVIPYTISRYCMNHAHGVMGELAQATAMYGYYAQRYFSK